MAPIKIALVTGANKGIGKKIAQALAQRGFHVLIGARKKDLGEAAAAELRDHGDVSVLQLDVADHKSVTAAAEDVKSKFGHLDVLVNNAGIARIPGQVDMSGPELDLAKAVVPLRTHQDLLCASYHLRASGLFQQLVEAGQKRGARSLLEGAIRAQDTGAEQAAKVLTCLHGASQAVDLNDPLLRVSVGLRLALHLEAADDNASATSVLKEVIVVAEKFRTRFLQARKGNSDEHLLWISASRSQPSNTAQDIMSGMEPHEAALAGLHADAVALLMRLELAAGQAQQQAAGQRRHQALTLSLDKRKSQSAIWGKQTAAQQRLDQTKLQKAGTVAPHPQQKERELEQLVNRNPYQHVLLRMHQAAYQPQPHQQLALLQDAFQLLHQAQTTEDVLFKAAQPASAQLSQVPLAPCLLTRTPTSITLTHRPFRLKTNKKAAFFAVFAKSFGAGVALGMNSTSMELEGTGVQQPLGTRVTVSGLQPNETYSFAVAAYDADHRLVSELGQSAGPVAALLPLPLYHCWCHLVLTAAQLGVAKISHLAANVVLPHFLVTQPECPVWEANPIDRQNINRDHMVAASPALLHLVCQTILVTCQHEADQLDKQLPDPAMRQPCVPHQILRLQLCKRLLLAMQVAAYIGDSMLLSEAAIRFHNCVAPLLAAKAEHGFLRKGLAACHITLAEIKAQYASSVQGSTECRQVAGQVAASVAYHLLNGCKVHKEAEAADWLANLDMALLQPAMPQPGATIKVTVEQQALEDYLLLEPPLKAAASQLLSVRAASPDIVTQVLTQLSSKPPQELWSLIHADAAAGGKPAKAAPAKAPAAVKGKAVGQGSEAAPESFSQHPRYMEMCVRVMEAALQQGLASSIPAWSQAVLQNIRATCKMPRAELTRWKLDEAAALIAALAGADAAAASQAQRSEAAVRLLQQRTRQLMPRRKQILKQRAALDAAWPWLARLHCILVLGSFARAVQCCQRGASWLQLTNVCNIWWNCARPIFNKVPSLTQPTAKASWQVDTPPSADPVQPTPKSGASKAATAQAAAQATQVSTPPASSPLPAEALDSEDAAPTGPVRWKYVGGSPNAARFSNATIQGVLHLLALMRQGVQVHAGLLPAAKGGTSSEKQGVDDKASSSGVSLGSDALMLPWYTGQSSLDMGLCCNLTCMALAVLHRMKRYHTVVQVGRTFQEVSEGHFTERIAPFLMQAAPFAGVDRLPFQQALQNAVRDKRKAVEALESVRLLVADKVGHTSLLAERPGKRMAKHKSRALSTSLSQRRASQMTGSQRGSVMGERRQSELGSVISYATAATNASRSSQPAEVRLPAEYVKVIDQLGAAREKALQVEATNELGDVHAHFGSWPEAVQAWHDALDCIMGPYQVIKCWRQHIGNKTETELLQQYGVPGLLISSAVILGKLVQLGALTDLHTQLEGACMAARLVGACFSCSLIHPQRPLDFATYTPLELWEGSNLFHDPYRCNVSEMLDGLPCIIAVLLENGHALASLPLIAVLEWLAQHIQGLLPATVAVRLQRAQALTQLGLLAEAASVLAALMQGEGLPDTAGPTAYLVRAAGGAVQKAQAVPAFNNAELPGHSSNKACLDFFCTQEVAAPVAALYGPALTFRLTIARAHWLRVVGQLPDVWKQTVPYTAVPALAPPVEKAAKAKPGATPGLPAVEGVCLDRAAALLQGLLDRLQSTGAPSDPKTSGKPTGPKSPVKAPVKAAAQPEAVTSPDAPAGPPPADLIIAARLHLSQVLLAQWTPAKALEQVMAAVKTFHQASQTAAASAPQLDASVQQPTPVLKPHLWLQCRLQALKVLKEMQQRKAFTSLLGVSLAEAAKTNDKAQAAQMRSLDLSMHIAAGTLPDAWVVGHQLIEQHKKASLPSSSLAEVYLVLGNMKDDLGLFADAQQLWQEALDVYQQECSALGFKERQAHPELRNLYTVHTEGLIHALMRKSVSLLRQQQAPAAVEAAQQAFAMVQQLRCLPLLQAQAAALLGHCCTVHSHLLHPPLAAGEMASTAKASLQKVITWCTTDAAGPSLGLLRGALLDLASLLLAEGALPGALACLQGAAASGTCRDALLSAPQVLGPITATAVPAWAIQLLQGQEVAFAREKGLAEPPASLDPSLLARLLLCHYAGLVTSLDKPLGEPGLAQSAAAQALQLHTLLKESCPQYKAKCCLPEGPLIPDSPAAPAADIVAMQWHLQEGSWQDPSSWHCGGSMSKLQPSLADLLSLQRPARAATLLFVINAPTGMLTGEAVFDAAQLSRLDMSIKAKLLQVTNNQQALGDDEVSKLKASVSAIFSKQQTLTSSRPSTAPHSDQASASPASVTPGPAIASGKAADKTAAPGKKGKVPGEPTVPLLSTVAGQQQELMKWSNMLQANNGIILQDAECADWLANLLKIHCMV
ncbi:hypothetical protein WJX82_010821 [Trebouxia sp. C0006]